MSNPAIKPIGSNVLVRLAGGSGAAVDKSRRGYVVAVGPAVNDPFVYEGANVRFVNGTQIGVDTGLVVVPHAALLCLVTEGK